MQSRMDPLKKKAICIHLLFCFDSSRPESVPNAVMIAHAKPTAFDGGGSGGMNN